MAPSTWEMSDWIHVYALVDSGVHTLLDTQGMDIDNTSYNGALLEGQWTTLEAQMFSCSVQLVIAFESNANTETMYIDNVKLSTVPEPISMLLMGVGGIISMTRKTRVRTS